MLHIPTEVLDWIHENRRTVAYILLNLFCLAVLFNACQLINDKTGMKDDNIVEEITEAVIKSNTGIDIDLIPRSPE